MSDPHRSEACTYVLNMKPQRSRRISATRGPQKVDPRPILERFEERAQKPTECMSI
jgi:hypothetical protein